ncbi:MAG: ATP-binding cassette domain-containing protein [Acidimicrobiales bacterium]|jgi:putative ABC transport system ATP-binding protein
MAAAIEARRLSVRLGGRQVLDGLDLSAHAGRAVAISGHSGSGKTTLMLVLAGLLQPDEGRVELSGSTRRVGFVPQTFGLAPSLTAVENVSLPMQAAALVPPRDEIESRSTRALAAVGLAGTEDRLVTELSGGQRQRVAVARVLAGEHDVIIADEPTAELDADSRERVLRLLLDVAGRGRLVVIATHDPEVADCCDDWWELSDGRLEEVPLPS